MGKKSLPQVAHVQQPFGIDPPIVHCPICGQATLKMVKEYGKLTPCKHLAFIYVNAAGEFEYRSKELKDRIKTGGLEDFDPDDFVKQLGKAGYDNKLLILAITYGGMACGPIWFTDYFGFDYGTLVKKDKKENEDGKLNNKDN